MQTAVWAKIMGKEKRGDISNKTWTEVVKDYAGKDLGERKNWYGSVAEAYNRVRPPISTNCN